MSISTKEQRNSFKADYRISQLSAIGLVGLIAGCLILFGTELFNKDDNTKSVFSEVKFHPEEIVSGLLKKPIDSLDFLIKKRAEKIGDRIGLDAKENDAVTKMESEEKKIKQREADNNMKALLAVDTLAGLKAEQVNDQAIIKVLRSYSRIHSGIDAEGVKEFDKLNKALYFNITPSSFAKWEQKSNFKQTVKVAFIHGDIPFEISKSITLVKNPFDSDIQFINKYPAVGVWSLLIMIFISFCFITVANSINVAENLKRIFKDNDINNANSFAYYLCVLIVSLILVLINLLWKYTFFDEEVIKSLFFLPTLSCSMMWVIIIGYVAGAFCLGGFIYTAGALGFVNNNIQILRKLSKKTSGGIGNEDGNLKEIAKNENTSLNDITDEHTKQIAVQNNLLKFFNTYFLLSSVILSLMVLCTGGLYSLVNSLDFVKLLSDDWGYSPARMDFVLLYGGIHTVVLLLVYLPARMRFNEIPVQKTEMPASDESKKWYDIVKNPFAPLKEILVVVSPLLASLVQALFDLFFNK